MPKTVQIRDVSDQEYEALSRKAASAGVTVPELLRREIRRITSRLTIEEWLERTRRRPSEITREQTLATIDEIRGPWPSARD